MTDYSDNEIREALANKPLGHLQRIIRLRQKHPKGKWLDIALEEHERRCVPLPDDITGQLLARAVND